LDENQHLVTGASRTLVEAAYARAHLLDKETISVAQPELTRDETRERHSAKKEVDAAAQAISELRDEVQP